MNQVLKVLASKLRFSAEVQAGFGAPFGRGVARPGSHDGDDRQEHGLQYGNDLTSVLAVRALLGMPMVLELLGRLGRRQSLSHDRRKR